jgi:hypothetical protein
MWLKIRSPCTIASSPPADRDWWQGQFGDLLSDLSGSESGNPIFAADLNRQNIIHLSVPDAIKIQQWLETMLEEQQEQQFAWQQVKQECLNLILITIVRARQRNLLLSDQKPITAGTGGVDSALPGREPD